MLRICEIQMLLLILSLPTNTKSTKVLSDKKKCGDLECETSMSRVQAIKDYAGPDCRYLNFKTGEEIIVYFKLSRTREDLWAGSKGTDFGYFPMDAVQTEEVFITKEIEVPTKETDFLCLDGGDYIFENEESVFNQPDKGYEHTFLNADEKDSEFKLPEDEFHKHRSILSIKENKETFPEKYEFDSDSKDLNYVDIARHEDSKYKDSKNGKNEIPGIPLDEQDSQTLKPIPTPSTWTISNFAGWLGLKNRENKETVSKIPETTEEVTFRGRKITVTEDGEFKKPNEEGETEPKTSGWFQNTLTDLLHYGSEKSGLDLLYKENNPELDDSSTVTGNIDVHSESEIRQGHKDSEHTGSEASESNWFDLGLSDVLNFGYPKEDMVKETFSGRENVDHDAKLSAQNAQSTLIDEHTTKQIDETVPFEEQNEEKYNEDTSRETLESTLGEDEKYEQKENTHTNETDASVSNDFADMTVTHGSEPGNQAMGNINIKKAVTTESERRSDHSGEKPNNYGQHVEAKHIPTENMEKKMNTLLKNGQYQQELEEKLPGNNPLIRDYVLSNEGWLLQITLHLNDCCAFIASGFSVMISISEKVVAALPEDIVPGPDLYGCPWEIVIFITGILLVMCRIYQSIRSRLYVGKEKQLASQVAELIEDKRLLLEKFSFCKREFEELDNTLKDANFLQCSVTSSELQTECEELKSSNSVLENDIEHLEKELKEERSKRAKQDDLMSEMQRRIESLETEDKSIQSQIAEAKTTMKVYQINTERLKTAMENTVEENRHLHESEKQLLHEVEGWEKGCSELSEQINMFECSKADMEEMLRNKESQVKSMTECLLKMKDWSSAIVEKEVAEDRQWEKDTKSEAENGDHLDEQEKQIVRKLINAVKLNAHLKSVETERNQIYAKLTEENKAKEELEERIESQQKNHIVSQSEIKDLGNEVEKLQQKLKVMTELYQENEMNLHRKLTVEEKERLQKEEKLSKIDEKIIHAAEELSTYRQRAKDLEEELERTVHSYQNQLMYHEKKSHDNWLSSRAAERHLSDIRKENWHVRQKITESEFRYDVLKKDPYALDVPVRTFGREHSPYGVSPMSRPSSETRAFLSPPTLLEGPLRFSPVLPGGGGRGPRGSGNTGTYDIGSERGEMNSDRLSDHYRPSSDTGSLSPPWDRDQRIISSHTDRPAYENNPNMDLSGNGIKDHPDSDTNAMNRVDQSLVAESENFGPPNGPPIPRLRAPLIPVDPRGPFMRRGPPFPPMPPLPGYGPPLGYGPRDFSGLPPPPLMTMRSPFPVGPFSQYPPPRAGFLPPAPLFSDNRNEQTAEPSRPSPPVSTSVT